MIQAAGPLAVIGIKKLINLIIEEGYIPEEWNLSYIIVIKGKKMLWNEEVIEHVLENIMKDQMCIDSIKAQQMPYLLCSNYTRSILERKKIHFMFADLEKDFSRIPIKVLW